VEIGVEHGYYAKNILAEDPSTLLLVDPWIHQENTLFTDDQSNVDNTEFEKRFQSVQQSLGKDQRVTICRSFSVQAAKMVADGSMYFIYIDACHAKAAVLEDMNTWWPKVAPGGWMCGHDFQYSEVANAVSDFCAKENVKLAFATKETVNSWAIKK
jgi:hypothetical protein